VLKIVRIQCLADLDEIQFSVFFRWGFELACAGMLVLVLMISPACGNFLAIFNDSYAGATCAGLEVP